VDAYARKHMAMGCKETQARIWVAQMLHSVDRMQSKGVVHRDLKLENLLVDWTGNCIITDFEMAIHDRGADDVLTGVELLGTPLYIPPETIRKRKLHKSLNDVWAVGVIAWELVSNSNPYVQP
jgi:serine/threonine protein kinase